MTQRTSASDPGNRADGVSLGKYSVGTDFSVGSAATRHWVNSVSDIYGPDEIDELLDDLNRLELAIFEADDFDIGDSNLDGPGAQTTTLVSPIMASPTWSIKSWDSHMHYHDFTLSPEHQLVDHHHDNSDEPTFGRVKPVVCFCDTSTFKAPKTILRVLLLATSIACLSTLLTSGTAKLGLFALPHLNRVRVMMFVTMFAIIFTTLVLFLNISHLYALLPVEYGKMQSVVYLMLTLAFLIASSFLLHALYSGDDKDTDHLPYQTKKHIFITAILGLLCSFETFLCMFNGDRSSTSFRRKSKLPDCSPLHLEMTMADAPAAPSLRSPHQHHRPWLQHHSQPRGCRRVTMTSASPAQPHHSHSNGRQHDADIELQDFRARFPEAPETSRRVVIAKKATLQFESAMSGSVNLDEIVALPMDDDL